MHDLLTVGWNLGAVTMIAYQLIRRAPMGLSALQRLTGFFTLVTVLPQLVLIGMTVMGVPLSTLSVTFALTAGLIAVALFTWWRPPTDPVPMPATGAEPAFRSQVRGPELLGAAALGASATAWSYRTLIGGTQWGWDDLTYHASIPAWWLQSQTLDISPYSYQTYYPLGTELFSFFFLLTTNQDGQVAIAVWLWGILALVAGTSLASSLAQARGAAWACVGLILASPVILLQHQKFAPTDLASAALVLAVLALSYPTEDAENRTTLEAAALAGLAMGGAMASKVIIAPAAVVMGLYWIYRGMPEKGPRKFLPATIFTSVTVLVCGWWFARNWALTGNPMFPAAFAVFEGPLGPDAQAKTSLIQYLRSVDNLWAALGVVIEKRWSWPLSIGLLSAIGWLSWIPAVTKRRADPRTLHLLMMCAIAVLVTAFYVTAPFSGTGDRLTATLHDFKRYLALPYALGLVMAASWIPRGGRSAWSVLIPCALMGWVARTVPVPILSAGLVGAAIGATAYALSARPPIRQLRRLPLALALAAVVALAAMTPMRARSADKNLLNWPQGTLESPERRQRPMSAVWRALEKLPEGARVGYYSGLPFFSTPSYPYFGRRYQLSPVPLEENGTLRSFLHENWREGPADWWVRVAEVPTLPPARFVANLKGAEVDFVVVAKCGHSGWPPQRALLVRSPSTRVFRNQCGEIWEVNGIRKEGGRRSKKLEKRSGNP